MTHTILYHGGTSYNEEVEQAIAKVIKSGFVGEGNVVKKCAQQLQLLSHRKYTTLVSSGSEAISLTLRAAGIKQNDKVGVPAFISAIVYNTIKSIGAIPYPIDINPLTYTLDSLSLNHALPYIQALLINHPIGYPDIEAFQHTNLPKLVIEDCADAFGIKPLGNLGDVSIGSFYATKLIGGTWGGFITTNNHKIYESILDLKSPFKDTADTYRLHYKSNNLDSSVALIQLNRLSEFIQRRKIIANLYFKAFKPLENKGFVTLPMDHPNRIWGRFLIQTSKNQELLHYLKKNAIIGDDFSRWSMSAFHYTSKKNLKNLIDIKNKITSIPLYPSLTNKQVKYIIKIVLDFFYKQA